MDEVIEAIEKYQELVPLVYDIETMGLAEARPQDMYYAVYLKREADKVIAHHKYKRCLDKVKQCTSMMIFNSKYGTDKKWHLFKKWRERWLELAEKFKDKEA